MRYILVLAALIIKAQASEIHCRDFEVFVRKHEVKPYKRESGAVVHAAQRKAHCRTLYPRTENWIDSFQKIKIAEWPYDEAFKDWTKKEKEIVLKLISQWPDVFSTYTGIALHRAVSSITKGNPAGVLPKSKAIVLYDEFFRIKVQSRVLSHEMAHIYILNLEPDKLKSILKKTGWDYDKNHRPVWSGKKPLKPDSIDSPSEDLANHIEEFLHQPDSLHPEIRKSLEDLLGKDFKLKEN